MALSPPFLLRTSPKSSSSFNASSPSFSHLPSSCTHRSSPGYGGQNPSYGGTNPNIILLCSAAAPSSGNLSLGTSVSGVDETLAWPQKDSVKVFEDPVTHSFSSEAAQKQPEQRLPSSRPQVRNFNEQSRCGLTRRGSDNEQGFEGKGANANHRLTKPRGSWNRGGDVANELIAKSNAAKDEKDLAVNVLQKWSQPLSARNIVAVINNIDTWRKAYAFFEWVKAGDRYEINKFVYNVLLKALRRGKQWQLCEKLAEDMIAEGLEPDNYTYSILISCAKQCNETKMALKWFDKMNQAGCVPDEVTYSTMIDVYGAAGMTDEALALYDVLRRRGWNPDQVTFGTIANVYAKAGDYRAIERLLLDMKELGAQPNAVIYNTYMQALNKACNIPVALNVLCEMENSGIKPTSVTLSILIEMYSKVGTVDEAFKISRKMQQAGLVFDIIVYNSLISACAENSLLKEAEDILTEMKEAGLMPDEATYRCMVSVYATKGIVEKAREFIDKFLEEGFKPNVQLYSSLLRACKEAQQYDKVPSYFEEMILQGCKPDQRYTGILLACISTCENKTLQEGMLNCLQWISITLHAIAKKLLTKDANGPLLEKHVKMAFEEMDEDSYLPFCNTLIDMCMNLGYYEGAHQIVGIAIMLGVYGKVQIRSELEWRLNIRGLSLSAAGCAVEGWMTSLKLAFQEGEQFPRHFVIELGSGSRVSDSKKLNEVIPTLLKKVGAPFELDSESGAFVAAESAVRSWLGSRQVSHDLT